MCRYIYRREHSSCRNVYIDTRESDIDRRPIEQYLNIHSLSIGSEIIYIFFKLARYLSSLIRTTHLNTITVIIHDWVFQFLFSKWVLLKIRIDIIFISDAKWKHSLRGKICVVAHSTSCLKYYHTNDNGPQGHLNTRIKCT